MSGSGQHLGREYFATQYEGADDPWGFDSRWYERRKHALTLALLPRAHYRRAVEPGCANGTLTELLASRCDELHAFDMMAAPVARARARLADQPHVTVRRATFPTWWPAGRGDLVVWSEVAYYLTDGGAAVALAALSEWLRPGGTLVAVHWTGPTNYPRPGVTIGPWLDGAAFLRRDVTHSESEFTAGVWTRAEDAPHGHDAADTATEHGTTDGDASDVGGAATDAGGADREEPRWTR